MAGNLGWCGLRPCVPRNWVRNSRHLIAALLLLLFVAPAAFAQQGSATIRGKVQDVYGDPVGAASVRLEHAGNAPQLTKSNLDGDFTFKGLDAGDYVVSAAKGGRHSRAVAVKADPPSQPLLVRLVLDQPAKQESQEFGPQGSVNTEARKQEAGTSPGTAMEFADNPNFTVAAVTDWTAAGGHGSDTMLRTSEALNREALSLKPGGPGAGNPSAGSESVLRAAVARTPGDFAANRKLGEFYLHANRFQDAIPPLEAAYKIDPANAPNEYDLALALKESGDLAQARRHAQNLLAHHESADAHRLAGEIDEKRNDPLSAVHEFERAAREDPSEQNYFEWGSELLLHRAVWQAKDVFAAGVKAYPQSARMLTALGAALFAGALYDESAERLCQASDLNPADPEAYLFMGKVEIASPNPLPCVEQKLARFAELRPQDALANYYYAMALWKQAGQPADRATLARVEDLLARAVTIDPGCGDGYFQLGVLEATRGNYPKAIGYYAKAIQANPQMSQAHYRLGVAYDRVGEQDKAKREFQLHDEIEKQQAAAVDKQRREVKQFLVVVDGKNAGANPQ